jgi:hypothetical protein
MPVDDRPAWRPTEVVTRGVKAPVTGPDDQLLAELDGVRHGRCCAGASEWSRRRCDQRDRHAPPRCTGLELRATATRCSRWRWLAVSPSVEVENVGRGGAGGDGRARRVVTKTERSHFKLKWMGPEGSTN